MGLFTRKCPRCREKCLLRDIKYRYRGDKRLPYCKFCKGKPDYKFRETRQKKFSRHCPICNEPMFKKELLCPKCGIGVFQDVSPKLRKFLGPFT